MKSLVNQQRPTGQTRLKNIPISKLTFLIAFLSLFWVSQESWSQTPSIPGTGTSATICGTCAPTGWDDIGGTPDISDRNIAGGGATLGAGATWVNAPLPLPPTGDVRWITMRDVGDFNTQADESVTSTITGLLQNRIYKLSVYVMTSFSNNDGSSGAWYGGRYMDDFGYQVGSNPRVDISINNATYQDQWALIDIIFVADNGTVGSPGSMDITIFPNDDAVTSGSSQNFEIIHFAVDDVNAIVILDTDGDGINDFADIDDDNDGILDTAESGGNDPNGDEDGDGIPNYLDTTDNGTGDGSSTDYTDADGNGLPDVFDFDRDGIPNHLDLDSDNDGILDNREFQTSSGYTAPSGSVGANGYYDIYETSVDSGTPNNTPVNTDSTGGDDYLDIDADDDGIPDNVEAQTTLGYVTPTGNVGENGLDSAYENVDTYSAVSITPVNTDLTDEPDYRDDDSDNDGTTDINENGEGNVLSGSDTDGDGLDNNFDADNVNYDVNDNIDIPQSDLPDVDSDVATGGDVDFRDDVTGLDSDGDGIPDTVDIDDDNDGIIDENECAATNFPASGANAITVDVGVNRETEILDGIQNGGNGARMNNTNDVLVLQLRANDDPVPAGTLITVTTTASNTADKQLLFQQSDASGNNTSNDWNVTYNMSPAGDQDFTGSGNGTIHTVLYTLATDATHIKISMPVRSGGRINMDYLEYAAFSICASGDTDGDGIVDSLDIDSDNDGIPDFHEAQSTAGFTARSGVDSDGDGLDDAFDDDLGGAANSNGITPAEFINTDGDALPDHLDIDADGDGIPDNVEAQSTLGYMAPNGVPGANGLDSAYDFNDSFSNTGLAFNPINTDGDAEPDWRDTDSDGDGTDDIAENGDTDNTASGTDTDGDGLDDNFDDVDTSGSGIFDVNDDNDDPSTSLGDVDGDVNSGGDMDYRDTLSGTDTDGDGIVDSVDIDDDNDGILDTDECVNVNLQAGAIPTDEGTAITLDVSVNRQERILTQDNNGAEFNSTSDVLVVFFDETLPVGTTVIIRAENDQNDPTNNIRVEQATLGDGSDASNPLDIDNIPTSYTEYSYTITGTSATHLRLSMTVDEGGRVEIDHIRWDALVGCVDFDTDGDGIVNRLDQDADGDGILDVVEAQTTAGYVAPTGPVGANGLYNIYENNDTPSATGLTPVNTDSATESVTVPDYLDIDSDNDGIPDNVEAQTTVGYTAPTGNVGLNGVDSAYELNDTFTATALDPVNFDGTDEDDYRDTDSDNDGTDDDAESGITANGGGTADSDGDGLLDTWEGADATAGEAWDANDEINDPVNNLLDEDGDGGTTGDVDYRDTASVPDSDGDGVTDDIDVDDDNDGILDVDEDAEADADSDGIPNRLDIDSDDDGIPDNIEAQLTSSYIAPSGSGAGITDANGNGLDDNYETSQGGTDITPVNTDQITGNNSDALPDYLDTDTDGDGTLDINENGNANSLSGTDTDGDGLDDAFEGVLNDNDVNDDIDDPTTDLPDLDSDVNTADGAQPDAAEYNDVDYRDIDDDRLSPSIPGNILWLRADIQASETSWIDQSGSGNNATNGANQPELVSSGVNFNPTFNFDDGNNESMVISSGIFDNLVTYPDITAFIVSKTESTGNSYGFQEFFDGGEYFLITLPYGDNQVYYGIEGGSSNINNGWTGTAGTGQENYEIHNFFGSSTAASTPTGTSQALYRNGLLLDTGGTWTVSTGNTSNDMTIGVGDTNEFYDGDIAEIIVFSEIQSDLRQQQIQSYLAIKYGITLDQTDNDTDVVEGDYILEDLTTVVWDESANSAYHNDIAGIGRDDAMFLNQKQSQSVNTSAAVTIGLGSIADSNANNGSNINSDESFLMWGHNGVAINSTNTSSVALLCENELQLDRVWKIVETGSIGQVEVAIDQSLLDGALTTPTTEVIVFKVADDANFTTNVKHIPVSTRTVNGTASYVVDFDFNGTKYFTYSEVLGIFWNGDSNAWTGGAGTAGAPDIDPSIDGGKVLVIDAETSGTNAIMTASANVECLWVKPNSKLVVNDDLFIEFNEDFVLEGEVRLIGDAQLWQSHAGISNVVGNGVIYRDQEASVPSIYRYHYWSSPVRPTLASTNYSVGSVMYDGTTPTSENSALKSINWLSFIWPDVATLNGATTDPITIANYWIFAYFNGTTRDDWTQKLETGTIDIAEGFIMKSTGRAPQNFTFMGSPNDGTYTKVLTPGTTSLLGNPYPSVIDTQQFISDNSQVIDGTLYFWEHQGETFETSGVEGHGEFDYIGGYSQRNEAMGVAASSVTEGTAGLGEGTYNAPPQYIAVGQGFFASVPADKGGTLTFENSQRFASTNNIFFRNNDVPLDSLPNFKLGMDFVNDKGANIHRQLGVNFKKGHTYEYENGYDSRIFDLQPTDAFWNIPEAESNLVIAGVDEVNADLQIPLGIQVDTENPVYIMIDETNKLDGITIYLGDLVSGRLFNLSDGSVELDLPVGSYEDRFVVLFGGEALGTNDNPLFEDFNLFMNNNTDQIVIRNNNNSVIEKVELFNMLGQSVKTWNNIDGTKTQHTLDVFVPSALYVVKVTTERGEITKKIIVD